MDFPGFFFAEDQKMAPDQRTFLWRYLRQGFVAGLLCFTVQMAPAFSHPGVSHDAPHGASPFKLPIAPSSELYAVEVITRNAQGEPTPAFLAVQYADSWQWLMLEQPFLPNPRTDAQRSYRPQWKTKFPIHSNGRAQVRLPKGHYILHAGKGLEYAPVKQSFEVGADNKTSVEIKFERFVDMPAKGWWSGDTHVHASRLEAKDNRELLWAAQAEDIHIASILLMGDAAFLQFPQYALGKAGIVRDGDYWLAPGQEEPRTSELGHTIMLNTQRLFRNADNYYRYDTVFKEARQEGALTGIAHFFGDKFLSRNAGALLLAEDLVDFVELLDDTGMFKPEHYYDALNMGVRLTLSAGSDFPWGAHIGDNRTYALLPPDTEFTPDNWYAAVKAGRTFVTQGPLLDFQINGQPIGSNLQLRNGDRLNISVRAEGHPDVSSPKRLWLVSMGETIKQIEAEQNDAGVLAFSLTLTARHSQWFAVAAEGHNGAVAHSSPIYVRVNGAPTTVKAEKLLLLYEQNLGRINRLRNADFIPPEQKAHFTQWLDQIQALYLDKIADLKKSRRIWR